jgi:hypothetical protein
LVSGGFYSDGAHTKRNKELALKHFRLAADQGQPEAETTLGMLYFNGLAEDDGSASDQHVLLQKNEREAVRLYRSAAEKGHAPAQYYLGVCLEDGLGTVKNEAEACHWYKLAADHGYADAEFSLGTCYEYGCGVLKDLKEAIRLYRLAAQHLQADAQYSLGVCYADGHIRATEEPFEGVNMEAEAFKWYKLAAAVYANLEHMIPDDVADAVLYAVTRPLQCQVADIILYCNNQSGPRDIVRAGPSMGSLKPK